MTDIFKSDIKNIIKRFLDSFRNTFISASLNLSFERLCVMIKYIIHESRKEDTKIKTTGSRQKFISL